VVQAVDLIRLGGDAALCGCFPLSPILFAQSQPTLVNIVYLTTEAVPFAKTGGLADVCGTLPACVAQLGHQAAIIMPAFRSVHQAGVPIKTTNISFAIPLGPENVARSGRLVGARLLTTTLPDSNVPVWLIDQPQYFDRDSLYGTPAGDYPDNAERFIFFCRAAMQVIARMGWSVDIVHCNDWQTGLVPAFIKAESDRWSWIGPQTKSVMTIHNMAYQGQFDKSVFPMTGLDWSHFTKEEFEYYDQVNFLKTGLITTDRITTVSPRYSHEIRTPEQGCGLDSIISAASDHVTGIINGIDVNDWNPKTDSHLFTNYDVNDWQGGKSLNKLALQYHFGMEESREIPLIGLVGRLASQKGWDMILPVLRQHLSEARPTQWVVLGSGEERYEEALRALAEEYPGHFGLHVGFSNKLAHQIEAASDVFLMPSHYEPCGLNQLYSLRYGTIPIVTPTGGLADTVTNYSKESLALGTATGFYVEPRNAEGLDAAIGRALQTRFHRPDAWSKMVVTGMNQDWSWTKSAREYVKLYEETIALSDS
jgi:starch synthase